MDVRLAEAVTDHFIPPQAYRETVEEPRICRGRNVLRYDDPRDFDWSVTSQHAHRGFKFGTLPEKH